MGGTVVRFVALYIEGGVTVFNKHILHCYCDPVVLSPPQFCEITAFIWDLLCKLSVVRD